MTELWQWSAVEIAAAVRERQVSVRDVTEAHLERMAAANPRVNAVTLELSELAMQAAARADEALAAGTEAGPLHGVPVTIKENVDQAGLPNTNGVPAFAEVVAPDDAPLVKNLLRAGAIVIGRTNTPEFSHRYVTDNPLRGRTLNPWRDDLTPGGSSGGAAAAVSLGIGAIGHGNDLAGSLRYPAYCCGCVTIKPGLGRVPAFNPSQTAERPPAIQQFSVQGPITRSVADARLALSVMSGESAQDPWWCPAPLDMARPDQLRVAVSHAGPLGEADHAVRDAVATAAAALKEAGHAVEERDPPDLLEARDVYLRLMRADYEAGMRETVDRFGSETLARSVDIFYDGVPRADLAGYQRDMAARGAIRRRWLALFDDVDAVLMPVSLRPPEAQDFDVADDAVAAIRANAPMQVINLLGFPAAAVPTGVVDGVPMGVQIVAGRFREDMALAAAEVVERAVGPLCQSLWAR